MFGYVDKTNRRFQNAAQYRSVVGHQKSNLTEILALIIIPMMAIDM